MCCFGPYRDLERCQQAAGVPQCDHDHMVIRSTPRQLVERLPSTASYFCTTFWVPQGGDEVMAIAGGHNDIGGAAKLDLYDEMADAFEQRNSSRSASIAS